MSTKRPLVRATDIAEYIRYQSCDRRFKLKFNDAELAKEHDFLYNLIKATSLDPVLEEEGRRRENEWETSQLIFTENVNGHIVEVFTPPLDEISEI